MENKIADEFKEKFSELSYKAQDAVLWMIENLEVLNILLSGKLPENIEEKLKSASIKEDYHLYLLLCLKNTENESFKD